MMFAVGLYGDVHKNEARRWYNTLCRHAQNHPEPFYALIDLHHVPFIGSTARIQFADATRLPQVQGLLFITGEPHMQQTVRMIGMLGEPGSTYAFNSLQDAREFIAAHAPSSR
jgi:anti-anti-sigma regulatory factor